MDVMVTIIEFQELSYHTQFEINGIILTSWTEGRTNRHGHNLDLLLKRMIT